MLLDMTMYSLYITGILVIYFDKAHFNNSITFQMTDRMKKIILLTWCGVMDSVLSLGIT